MIVRVTLGCGTDFFCIASVLFSASKHAQDAVNKLHAHVFKGSLLSVTLKKRIENLVRGSAKSASSFYIIALSC